jgi:hypothetical protein
VVDTAPPPAKIEHVPDEPSPDCAWLDGQWLWVGQHWQWAPGSWVIPPPDCHYADPTMTWLETATGPGVLYYLQGAWYPDHAGEHCRAAQSCLAPAQRIE